MTSCEADHPIFFPDGIRWSPKRLSDFPKVKHFSGRAILIQPSIYLSCCLIQCTGWMEFTCWAAVRYVFSFPFPTCGPLHNSSHAIQTLLWIQNLLISLWTFLCHSSLLHVSVCSWKWLNSFVCLNRSKRRGRRKIPWVETNMCYGKYQSEWLEFGKVYKKLKKDPYARKHWESLRLISSTYNSETDILPVSHCSMQALLCKTWHETAHWPCRLVSGEY